MYQTLARRFLPALLLACLAATAQAQSHHAMHSGGDDSTGWVTSRHPLDRSTYHIVSRDGTSALLLTDTTIIAQLTDAGMTRITKSTDSSLKQQSVGMRLVASMASGLLEPLFDHGIEYSLRDLADAQYTDGRLLLRSRDGSQPFGDVDMFGHQLMESFNPADAKAFAARANQARARLK